MGKKNEWLNSYEKFLFSSETNLKPREALIETIDLQDDIEKLSNFNGKTNDWIDFVWFYLLSWDRMWITE